MLASREQRAFVKHSRKMHDTVLTNNC